MAVSSNSPALIAMNEPINLTKLQAMLWRELQVRWREVCESPLRHKVKLIEDVPEPRTAESVFSKVMASIERGSVDVLAGLWSCAGDAEVDHASGLFSIVRAIALVATERFILDSLAESGAVGAEAHRPVLENDPSLASIVAAARIGFGLLFKTDQPKALNVVDACLPQAEFGCAGEEGVGLARGEVFAAAHRVISQRELPEFNASLVSDVVFKATLSQVSEILGCAIVLGIELGADPAHALAADDARKHLVAEMNVRGVPVFFRQTGDVERDQAANILFNNLIPLITPFLPKAKSPTQEPKTMPENANPATAGVVNNFTFNAPVGAVAQANAPGAVAAGRDVVIGVPVANLPALLAELTQALQAHPVLAAQPELADHVEDLKAVAEKQEGERTDKDARTVKRCLEALKDGAELAENSATLLEKLSPVWDTLKTGWPALAALLPNFS